MQYITRGKFTLFFTFIVASLFSLFFLASASAASYTWDGGGATENWSDCDNWSTNICPIAGDAVMFNATSTKNSVVDAAWTESGGVVTNLTLASGYSGTLSLSRSLGVSGTFSIADGVFTANAESVDFSAVTISGGVFNASTGTMTISGSFTHTAGGTFNHQNGTVVNDSPSGSTWNVNTSEEFYNFTFDSSSASFATTISSGDTLNINGALVLTDGFFNTGTIAAKGSTVSIGSEFGDDANASGTLLINGSGAQSVTIAPQTDATFEIADQFTLNNASATVTGTGTTGRIGFDKVTVTAGLLNLDGYDATINETTLINGGTLTFGGGTNVTTGTFTLSSGTFNGGSGSIDANGAITISGGAYNATSGSMSLSANFTHTAGGTFSHQNGTIIIDGSSTWDVATTEELFNLEVNNSNNSFGAYTVSNGDTLNVNGTLTLTDGWIAGASGTIAAKGGVSVGALFGSAANANGNLLINGSGTQSVTIAPQTEATFEIADQFTLNNASATVTGTGSTGRIGFDKITVTAGTLNMDGYNLFANEAVVVNGGTLSLGDGTHTFQNLFTLSSGTINGGSSTTTFSGSFAFTDGTYNASTGTMVYLNSWTHNSGAGTFNHMGGTSEFRGGNTTIDVASSETFGSIILNKNNLSILTISAGDNIIATGTLTLTEGRWQTGTLSAQGDVNVGADFDNNSPANFIFSGGNVQTLTMTTLTAFSSGDVYVNKSGGQLNLGSTWTMGSSNNDLIVQEGTLDLNGYNLTVAGAGTETFIIEDGGNLQLQGGETITGDSASYPQLDSGSTVTYDGTSGPYTMKDYTYHHLTIAGGANSVFTQAANESYGGNVTITSGILSQGGFSTTVTGTFSNLGTLRRLQAEAFTGTMDIDSGTVEYVGDGDGSAESVTIADFGGTDYYNLKINDGNATKDTFTIGATLTVAGTLQVTSSAFQQSSQTISAAALTVDGGTFTGGSAALTVSGAVTLSSGTLTATSNTFSVGGAWTNTAGTFNHNDGTVVFDTASASAISGDTTFYNFTSTTAGKALTFTENSTQTISGLFTLTGASGDLIVLRSSSDDTAWNLILNGTSSVDYVNVRDSNAGGGNPVTHAESPSRSISVANNINWSFNAEPEVVIDSVTAEQTTDGSGDVTIVFILEDDDGDSLQAKVEYSLDGGDTWELDPPTLSVIDSETSATYDDPTVDNAQEYQLSQITTASGANTVSIVWEAGADLPGTTDISNARIRITPDDGTVLGVTTRSSNFILDLLDPSGLSSFNHGSFSSQELDLSWNPASDSNFSNYEIWYAEEEDEVENRNGSALEWDNSDDVSLADASTASATLTIDPRNKYFQIFALDDFGNSMTTSSIYVPGGKTSGSTTSTSSSSDTSSDNSSDSSSSGGGSSGGGGGSSTPVQEEEEEVIEEEVLEEENTSFWNEWQTPEHWSKGYIKYLSDQNNVVEVAVVLPTFTEILQGIFTNSDKGMNRGEVTEFLIALAGYQIEAVLNINIRELRFRDVGLTHKRLGIIQFAYDYGLINGYPDGTFGPEKIVNRAEALKFASYFFGIDMDSSLRGQTLLSAYDFNESPFSDVDLEAWYAPYVIHAYANGVVKGYGDGTFGPANEVTYAEFLKISVLYQNFESAISLASELE